MSATSTMIVEIPQRSVMSLQAAAPPRSSSLRTDARFGKYILGQTLGEGEFGKVKLGWAAKRNDLKSDAQVAIKLIRKESVGTSRSRMNKIEREIVVLQRVNHPNIVRCHEVVETERYIGIILEYASGGELFDYILAHRYLKDPTACKLFAQLISAVHYLHVNGIVHRDLKLENLLLDRNRNIIITDFGFANTFTALSSEEDAEIQNSRALDNRGAITGDLMQTSCGSPCYAAPELVVGDGKYCGRKVDVWSCGVILYAMLAGYLPFDDDPANPEGDNISLLYRYIVNTPLTFPEYVTPLARDLLRRILVPNPQQRTCLDEITMHPWLKPHARLVQVSKQNSEQDRGSNADLALSSQAMLRSSSERTASHPSHTLPLENHLVLTGSCKKTSVASQDRMTSNNKRHTLQIEYEAPVRHNVLAVSVHKPFSTRDERTLPTNSLSVAAAPSMARSASHSGANHQDALAETPPGAKSYNTKASTRLPGPAGRPRPTSYHPSSCIIPEIDSNFAVHSEFSPGTVSKRSDHTKRWSRVSFSNAKTASPRSTKQNASGELTTSKMVVKRVTLDDTSKEATLASASSSSFRHHKRNSSSISSILGKFWPTGTSKISGTTDFTNQAQATAVMEPIQETLIDGDLPRTKADTRVKTGLSSEDDLARLEDGQAGILRHDHGQGRLDAITGPVALKIGPDPQPPTSMTRGKTGKTHERISSSAARRVMDFFTSRRKDRPASNPGP